MVGTVIRVIPEISRAASDMGPPSSRCLLIGVCSKAKPAQDVVDELWILLHVVAEVHPQGALGDVQPAQGTIDAPQHPRGWPFLGHDREDAPRTHTPGR